MYVFAVVGKKDVMNFNSVSKNVKFLLDLRNHYLDSASFLSPTW